MFNTAFISILGGTRFFYGNIKNNHNFNHLNKYGSPSIIILITFIIATVMSLLQNEVILAIITNFTVIIILLLLNLSYLRIKWKEDENNLMQFIYEGIPFIAVLLLLLYLFVQIIYLKYKGAF
jgi:amino acid transporter